MRYLLSVLVLLVSAGVSLPQLPKAAVVLQNQASELQIQIENALKELNSTLPRNVAPNQPPVDPMPLNQPALNPPAALPPARNQQQAVGQPKQAGNTEDDRREKPKISIVGTGSGAIEPNQGRIVASMKSVGVRTPEAILGSSTALGQVVQKLNDLGVKASDIKITDNVIKENIKGVEIYGGTQFRGTAEVRGGYVTKTTVQVTLHDMQNLKPALDILSSKGQVFYCGFASSKEKEIVAEARIAALKNVREQVDAYERLLNVKLRVVGVNEEIQGDRTSPVPGASVMVIYKLKVDFEADGFEVLTP